MLYLILIYLSLVYLVRDKLNSKLRFILLLTPLLVVIWTRYGIGADYFSYQDMYLKLEPTSLSSLFNNYYNIELGYKILMWPFRMLNIPYYVFLGILNTVVTVVMLKWIEDNSSDSTLSTLLFYAMFFLVWVLSAMRQSIVLAFGLYFLFNDKKNLSPVKSIILVLVLSLFHKSALFLFVFLVLRHINWNKKLHLIFMGAALVTTFLPLGKILGVVSFLPGVTKIIDNYLVDAVRFYDFPGLIRLGIFIGVILFYDRLTDKKKYADTLLYGMSVYFLLKFSEITASRATIYTFFMIIILVPDIVKSLNVNKNVFLKYAISFAMIAGAGVYFTKEFRTMFNQAEYVNPVGLKTYPNVFNQNISEFGSLQAYEVNLYTSTVNGYEKYKATATNEERAFNEKQTYETIKKGKNFVLLGQDGSIVEDLNSKVNLEIIDGVLLEDYYQKGHFFTSQRVKDLTDQNRTEEEMKEVIVNAYEKRVFEHKEERVDYSFEDLPEQLQSYYPNEKEHGKFVVNKMDGEVAHYVVRVEYHNRLSFIYLDENQQPLLSFPVKQATSYDSKGFLNISSYDTDLIINEDGEIIWWVK